MNLTSKLPESGTTIFTVMSGLATEYGAVNLSQGFPDYSISPQLVQYVEEAMRAGFNQYAPMPGLPALRNALSKKISALYTTEVNPETEITITPGATYAIYTALSTIVFPGDEVIVLEPAYDSYIPNIELNGGIAVSVPLRYPDYSVDWQLVEAAMTKKTKAIIINTPHNPTGYVWTRADMEALASLLHGTSVFVISDEVYEHITLDGRCHESVLKYPALRSRSFVLYSFGKVFHTTGWKMGYCVAPAGLTGEYRKIHQFLAFSCSTPMQVALSRYLEFEGEYLALPDFFEKKRDLFLELIHELPFTLHCKSGGSYFQVLGYEKISEKGDREFARWLTTECGVAAIPISAFNRDGRDDRLLRFCFAKKDSTLLEAANRLRNHL